MDNTNIVFRLTELGFTGKEAEVYNALVVLGEARMTELAQRTGLKRPTVYVIVESLKQKSLVSQIQKGKIDFYIPLGFEAVLYGYLEKTELAKQIALEVNQKRIHEPKSRTTLYEGRKQFEYIHDVMMRSKEVSGLVFIEEYWKIFGEAHNKHMFEILKRHGGCVRNLMPRTEKTLEYVKKKYRAGMQEIRFLPSGFDISNKVGFLLNDRMAVFDSFEPLASTAIEDLKIVKLQKQLWQFLWDQSDPLT